MSQPSLWLVSVRIVLPHSHSRAPPYLPRVATGGKSIPVSLAHMVSARSPTWIRTKTIGTKNRQATNYLKGESGRRNTTPHDDELWLLGYPLSPEAHMLEGFNDRVRECLVKHATKVLIQLLCQLSYITHRAR